MRWPRCRCRFLPRIEFVITIVALSHGAASSSVDVSPSSIDVFSLHLGVFTRTLEVHNPTDQSVTVHLRARSLPKARQRRLRQPSSSPRIHGPDNASAGEFSLPRNGALQRGLTGAEASRRLARKEDKIAYADGCDHIHRILMRLRPQNPSSANAMRRRLAEDEDLGFVKWRHLEHVRIEIGEFNCTNASAVAQAMRRVKERYGSELEFVEPDQWVKPLQGAMGAPNDPEWSRQWGMRKSKVVEAWGHLGYLQPEDTRPTVVAVIDTGVQLDHPDLRDVLWTNPGEIPGNGIDDDGNGYVDDVHGYDFYSSDADPSDEDGHGTHCAGVIAAAADNNIGVVGVAGRRSQARIMPLKFLTSDGGSTSDALTALEYAVSMGVRISSNSWGGGGASSAMSEALRAAEEFGHLFVVAAGNEASDNDEVDAYPCSYPAENILCVAAMDEEDRLAGFSNWGATSVDVGAPGVSIYNTVPGSSYRSMSGTSMATPHVAGAAALAWGAFDYLDIPDLRDLIQDSVVPLDSLEGKTTTGGRVDVEGMILLGQEKSWLRLVTANGAGSAFSMELGPQASSSIQIQIGSNRISPGNYSGEIDVEVVNGQLRSVPVEYVVQGWPNLTFDMNGTLVNFSTVSLGGSTSREVWLRNFGNGTALLRLSALTPPFFASSDIMSFSPMQERAVQIHCQPNVSGSWMTEVHMSTNNGLDPEISLTPDSIELGTWFAFTVYCAGIEPPDLRLDVYSGAAIEVDGQDGLFRFRQFEVSVSAEWEPSLPSGHSSRHSIGGDIAFGELVVAPPDNIEGCAEFTSGAFVAKIVLISRGTCYFQTKAQGAQSAGAVGVLVYDNAEPTTLGMMGAHDTSQLPTIPAFLITRAEGLALQSELARGSQVNASLSWRYIRGFTDRPQHPLNRSGMNVSSTVSNSEASITLANLGSADMQWHAKTFLDFGGEGGFYAARIRSFAWSNQPEEYLIGSFSENEVDDGTVRVELPFRFPFFGEMMDSVLISSNGLLAFDMDWEIQYYIGTDIPSTQAPNGFIAAYWDDLYPSSQSRISAGLVHGNNETGELEYFSVQWKRVPLYGHATTTVSFEARLYADGRVDVMLKRFPTSTSSDGGHGKVRVGLESMDGQTGIDVASSLQLTTGEQVAVSFLPWLIPSGDTGGILAESASEQFSFEFGAGGGDRQTSLVFYASDRHDTWQAVRRVRLSTEQFRFAWQSGAWTSCLWSSCDTSSQVGVRRREVRCEGSEGLDYDGSHCEANAQCTDYPVGWTDTDSSSCADYVSMEWCTSTGGYGSGWSTWWGTFDDYATSGYSAASACCGCGGGALSQEPASEEECQTPVAHADTDGDGTDDCDDACPNDAAKSTPGRCGCGVPDSQDCPTIAPTPAPTAPTQLPSPAPTASPTAEPTSAPTAPTLEPSLAPTQTPTAAPTSPTAEPTSAPTAPTLEPSSAPTLAPSLAPTSPTAEPTSAPTAPTLEPSSAPTFPTAAPTSPTAEPTSAPTSTPTAPTLEPSSAPTLAPTSSSSSPTSTPTPAPTGPTLEPSSAPTQAPTFSPTAPTLAPTHVPTAPTLEPSSAPTLAPTAAPTSPTAEPTSAPTAPTLEPSLAPTLAPSLAPTSPTAEPTSAPTAPTLEPSSGPTLAFTAAPTSPKAEPTSAPTAPTLQPSSGPTLAFTAAPTSPTAEPTSATMAPTAEPSSAPVETPSLPPTGLTEGPTQSPTAVPSPAPTATSPVPAAAPTLPTFTLTPAPTTPTEEPSSAPSPGPTAAPASSTPLPTPEPTPAPSLEPTVTTLAASANPTQVPSTWVPTPMPTLSKLDPTVSPTAFPTATPTDEAMFATFAPTLQPSPKPTLAPTAAPTPMTTRLRTKIIVAEASTFNERAYIESMAVASGVEVGAVEVVDVEFSIEASYEFPSGTSITKAQAAAAVAEANNVSESMVDVTIVGLRRLQAGASSAGLRVDATITTNDVTVAGSATSTSSDSEALRQQLATITGTDIPAPAMVSSPALSVNVQTNVISVTATPVDPPEADVFADALSQKLGRAVQVQVEVLTPSPTVAPTAIPTVVPTATPTSLRIPTADPTWPQTGSPTPREPIVAAKGEPVSKAASANVVIGASIALVCVTGILRAA